MIRHVVCQDLQIRVRRFACQIFLSYDRIICMLLSCSKMDLPMHPPSLVNDTACELPEAHISPVFLNNAFPHS